jgi:hypothetical protein
VQVLGYHPGHHPGHPAIVLVYPSFILPDYAIMLPGRMMGTKKAPKNMTFVLYSSPIFQREGGT